MRDPNRIPEILAEIEKVWKANPDLRFTQMIVNVMQINGSDLYYIEDWSFIDKLKEVYGL